MFAVICSLHSLCFVSLALSTNLPCSGYRKVASGTGTAIREDLLAAPALISLSKTISSKFLSTTTQECWKIQFVALSLTELCNCLPTHRAGCCYLCSVAAYDLLNIWFKLSNIDIVNWISDLKWMLNGKKLKTNTNTSLTLSFKLTPGADVQHLVSWNTAAMGLETINLPANGVQNCLLQFSMGGDFESSIIALNLAVV